ncbi:MAG: T9SS C-terminal target domain-containing protein [Cryomorphaceae bacterium]|nr:MAG: T9SS C-terminal target domain-containing protein [Cryomorphaceae bacterium]
MKTLLLVPFLTFVVVLTSFSQITTPVLSPALSPRIEWTSITWSPTNQSGQPQTQSQSGEDWWMDVIEYYENGVHVGYIASGYTTLPDFIEYDDYAPCANFIAGGPYPQLLNTDDHLHGIIRQSVGRFDLSGNMLWFKKYNIGSFLGSLQDDDGNIILAGFSRSPIPFEGESHMENIPMYVNPISGNNPSGFSTFELSSLPSGFCTNEGDRLNNFNVMKITPSGEVLYNNLFGPHSTLSEVFFDAGMAFSLTNAPDGGFYAVGRSHLVSEVNNTYTPSTMHPYIVKIDDNGHKEWDIHHTSIHNGFYMWIEGQGNSYVLAGRYNLASVGLRAFMQYTEVSSQSPEQDAFSNVIWDKYTEPNSGYESDGFNFDENVGPVNHGSFSATFLNNGDIVWPVAANSTGEFWGGTNVAQGKIYIFDNQGGIVSPNSQPIELGEIRAYDLYLSTTATTDGGFAFVTSRHSPQYFLTNTAPSYSDSDIGPCLDQIANGIDAIDPSYWLSVDPDYFEYWSTCAYVGKFNAEYEFEWDKIWDSTDNAPRECPPGNLKQQECVYRIVQTSDGGYIICGNTSDNLDDNYLVKIASDCGIRDFIAGIGPDGSLIDNEIITNHETGVYEITENTSWNSNKKVLGKVRVKDGHTLTIEGTTIAFAGNANIESKIEIEQNARLIVNNATLTNSQYTPEACSELWGGIEVWGTTLERQTPIGGYYHQGRFEARNNSKIENAQNAVSNWKKNDWDARGGIIQVSDTKFLNNTRSAQFMRYQNTNAIGNPVHDLSFFRNTEFFLTDDYFRGPQGAHPQVTLWGNHGVSFRGCEFRNDMTIAENSQQLTSGIYSHSAHYIVDDYCPVPQGAGQPCSVTPIPSSFTGFHHGILALITESGVKHINVSKAVFNENMTGIELRETDFSRIRQNEFYVGSNQFEPNELDDERNSGVYTWRTSAYSIEENHFEKAGSNGWPTHGAVIEASGAAENELYKNDIEGLMYGSVAIDNNRGGKLGNEGLQFLCNNNSENGRDFDVVNLNNVLGKGIRSSQGDYPGVAAANVFSQSSAYSLDFMHFAQDQDMPLVGYAWYTGDVLHEPSGSEVTSNVDLGYSTSNERTCASTFAGKHKANFKSAFDSASTEYYNLLYNYHQLSDGGDTEGLLDEIAGSWSQDAWDLRNTLLQDSPFLTVEVLIAAADRDIMPHAMLMEVLLANPDALRSSELIDHLKYYMPNPLPQYMIDILIDARNEITVKTNLLSAMGQKSRTMALNHKMVIQEMLADTLGFNPDSLLWFMGRLENIPNHYALAMTHLEMGDLSEGKAVLTHMPVIWDRMNTEEETEWEQFNDLYDLLRTVKSDGRNVARLKDVEIDALLTIAQTPNSGRAGGRAWNALCFHYQICPEGQFIPAPRSFQAYEATNIQSQMEVNPVVVYPNPADSYTTLRYELFRSHPQTYIRIFDVSGRIIRSFDLGDNYEGQVLWDTRDERSGMYFYQLWQNEEKVSAGKIVVQH